MIDIAPPRYVEEWVGKSPDTPPPARVQVRVYVRCGGRCQCGCNRLIRAGEKWQIDHTVALILGGENRESNLRLLLAEHHKDKTREDVRAKAKTHRTRCRHLGIKRRKSRPMPGSRASGWKRTMAGRWERRERRGVKRNDETNG